LQSTKNINGVIFPSQLDILMEAAGDAVFRLSDQGEILYASQRAIDLIGLSGSVVNLFLAEFVLVADRLSVSMAIAQSIETRQSSHIKVRITTHTGLFWFELQVSAYCNDQSCLELLIVGHNVSNQQATEERLRHMATHDVLTGLPNRSLLSDRLRMAMAQARRTGIGFAILSLDLDGFKKVNEALGHAVGDALLQIAAARLLETLRDVDTLARVGGDEFVALLPGAHEEAEIHLIAKRMIAAIQLPIEINDNILYVSASIGAAMYPQHGDCEVKLLAHADTALYRAKETGRSRCIVYDQGKFTQPEHDVAMEAAMFEAVRNGEFLLHYQPIVDARSRRITGFEALMRWMHPELGLVSPVQFIPMAESNGLINLLGAWALKAACVQIRKFEDAIGRKLSISVNVSPRQFRNDKFLEMMDDALRLSGLSGEQLVLEITEGILMSDPEHAETLLHSIKSRRVRIAIDDFGTGYSSLAYLKRFPISTLKIDRAFIKDLPTSLKDAAICNAVLSLAKHLQLTTVAEGVENDAQLAFLVNQGCDLIQGFYTGRPLLPAAAIDILKSDLPIMS
jgi:diguanylate cyclase (GGDEF)-like protein